MLNCDLVVIGAGIVGLATAWRVLERRPGTRVIVLDKELRVAAHQTGRNSGVLHSGVYYAPGSSKASNCRRGKAWIEAFCEQHGIRYERCGKVIVAVTEAELPALERIAERAGANGVESSLIGPERLAELEPHARGVRALHVPETGIVDFVGVCERLGELVVAQGGRLVLGARVAAVAEREREVVLTTTSGEVRASQAVNCAGLYSDRILQASGRTRTARIVPFRGEYFELVPSARSLCRNLIYPVPDPSFPFLGVHFTRGVDGSVECGPNAVLAFAREGYDKTTIDLRDLLDALGYRGFRRLAARHWRTGTTELWRSLSKQAFVRALRRLVPEVTADVLRPTPAGVRAQALLEDGRLVDDFLFEQTRRLLHVLNAPSPAATAALSIGEEIAERLLPRLSS